MAESPSQTQTESDDAPTEFDPDLADPLPELPHEPLPLADIGPPTYTLDLPFRGPLALAWALHSDTHKVNVAAGLSPYDYRDEPQPDGTTRRFFTTTANHIKLEGEEFFSAWEKERFFELQRVYSKGPFEGSTHRFELVPNDPTDPLAGGTCKHAFHMTPRGLLGKVWRWGFGREVLPAMRAYLSEAEERVFAHLQAERDDESQLDELPEPAFESLDGFKPGPDQIAAVERLSIAAHAISKSNAVGLIARSLLTAHDDEVQRIRPFAQADRWGLPRREALDAFLAATHTGMLRLRWDVICPHCRGDKGTLDSLGAVQEDAFCESCNLRFAVDLSRTLEAVFEPHPQVREVPRSTYCQGGPGTTPHIHYQRMLEPGETWQPVVHFERGRYRLRATGTDEFRWVGVDPELTAVAGGVVSIGDEGLTGEDPRLRPGEPAVVVLQNRSARRSLVVIEDVAWAEDALVAGELVADQRFRGLFSGEMLTTGVSLAVESVTILFTDLVGSTAMYGELGDARAFNLVWTHFSVLEEIVARHGGAIVKTIGDAIMAAFWKPTSALLAASELHDLVERHVASEGHTHPVTLKVGMHEGPSIVVTMNDRLDYFGRTVNLAARVESRSDGDDIVVSRHLARITEDCSALRDLGWFSEDLVAELKGIEEPVRLLRFKRTRDSGDGSFEALDMEL